MRFIFLLALLVACNSPVPSPEVKPIPAEPTPVEVTGPVDIETMANHSGEASQPIGADYPIANAKKVFTVKIQALNYTTKQLEKLKRTEVLIAKIFNSKEYKEAVENHSFKSSVKSFHDNNGLGNSQIYEKLFAGAEALQPAINYQLDLKVKMYTKKFSNVIGYTYPSDMVVYTNSKFHNSFKPCDVASNLVHEWTHKMGFSHDFNKTVNRIYSVPYAHGTIVDQLCPLAENNKLTPL